MTILITGAKGQLGNELTKILGEGTSSLGVLPLFYAQSKVISVDVDELDITDRWRFLLVLACLALALGIGVLYAYSNYRLVASGLDSNGRREIQLACINELNLKWFLAGYRPEILNGIGLHNTYLNLLVHFGILSLLFVFFYTRSLYRFLRTSFMFTGLLVLWGIYSLVESLSPFAVGDLMILPLLMLSLRKLEL